MRLSTLRNVLVISAVHTKSAECIQKVQSADNLQYNFLVGFVRGEN